MPNDHTVKVEKYNSMLEDVYQCEVELTNITPTLLDMCDQIAEEARILVKVVKKIKTNTKFCHRRSKLMGGEWDFQLELGSKS